MSRSLSSSILALSALAILLPPLPAEAKMKAKQANRSTPAAHMKERRVAQVDTSLMTERRVEKRRREKLGHDLDLRVGLLGGLSRTSTLASSGGAESRSDFANNLYVGLAADLRVKKYFGLELDGYMGLGSERVSSLGETISQRSHGLKASLKAQMGWVNRGVRYSPKLGLGYGFAKIEDSASLSGTTSTDSASLGGAHYLVGLDVEIGRRFLLGFDYTHSLFASGTVTRASLPSVTDASANGVALERFRLGAYYRFVPHFLGGLQYVRRGYRYEVNAGGSLVTEDNGLNQFLAVFVYEL